MLEDLFESEMVGFTLEQGGVSETMEPGVQWA